LDKRSSTLRFKSRSIQRRDELRTTWKLAWVFFEKLRLIGLQTRIMLAPLIHPPIPRQVSHADTFVRILGGVADCPASIGLDVEMAHDEHADVQAGEQPVAAAEDLSGGL
jgi:hypothetical protein